MLNDVSGSNDYLNFNKAPTYELTGGAPSGVKSIIEKLMKRTKPESSVFVNTLEQLKNTISELKSNVENTRNYVLPYQMNNNAMGYRVDKANYINLRGDFDFTDDDTLFRYDGAEGGGEDLRAVVNAYTIGNGDGTDGITGDDAISAGNPFNDLFERVIFEYIKNNLNDITSIVWDQDEGKYIVKTGITDAGLGQLEAAINSIASNGAVVALSRDEVAKIIMHRIEHPDGTFDWADYTGAGNIVGDADNDGRDIGAGPRAGGVDAENAIGINLEA
jgi:hypothetical protein